MDSLKLNILLLGKVTCSPWVYYSLKDDYVIIIQYNVTNNSQKILKKSVKQFVWCQENFNLNNEEHISNYY